MVKKKKMEAMHMVILLVGLGSIGKRHLKNVRTLYPDALLIVFRHQISDHDPDGALRFADKIIYDLNKAISLQPHVAIICNPASLHISTALQLAKVGIHLFIEKPLSNNLTNVQHLIEICQQKKLILMVGYNFRFSSTLQHMKTLIDNKRIGNIISVQVNAGQYLPDWRPNMDYHDNVSAQSDMGGGVLLELSHEVDYVCWILGMPKAVIANAVKSGYLDIDVEDSADMLLEFSTGSGQKIIANIHIDMLQRFPSRVCKVIGTRGTLIWNADKGTVTTYVVSVEGIENETFHKKVDRNEMYLKELRHFFDCVTQHKQPLVTGQDGSNILRIILAAKKSMEEGRELLL